MFKKIKIQKNIINQLVKKYKILNQGVRNVGNDTKKLKMITKKIRINCTIK
jgi:hypothetical protein